MLLCLFVLNVVLTLVDAACAYRNIPQYAAAFHEEPDRRDKLARDIRHVLPWLVALYSSLNCYAYSFRELSYVGGMTLLLLGDIVIQMYAVRRLEASEEQ